MLARFRNAYNKSVLIGGAVGALASSFIGIIYSLYDTKQEEEEEKLRLGQLYGCEQRNETLLHRMRGGHLRVTVPYVHVYNHCVDPNISAKIASEVSGFMKQVTSERLKSSFLFFVPMAIVGGMILGGIIGFIWCPNRVAVAVPIVPLPASRVNLRKEVKVKGFTERLNAIGYKGEIPDEFKCPITLDIMDPPVSLIPVTLDGEIISRSVDHQSFLNLVETAKQDRVAVKDPSSREEVQPRCMINMGLKNAIETWVSTRELEYKNKLTVASQVEGASKSAAALAQYSMFKDQVEGVPSSAPASVSVSVANTPKRSLGREKKE